MASQETRKNARETSFQKTCDILRVIRAFLEFQPKLACVRLSRMKIGARERGRLAQGEGTHGTQIKKRKEAGNH